MTSSFDDYLPGVPVSNRALIAQLHALVMGCERKVGCAIKWSTPWYSYNGKGIAYLKSNSAHVNLGFPRGAELALQGFPLEGTGKGMRHIKLKPGAKPDAALIRKIVHAALDLEQTPAKK
jgi:hypothetical protein